MRGGCPSPGIRYSAGRAGLVGCRLVLLQLGADAFAGRVEARIEIDRMRQLLAGRG